MFNLRSLFKRDTRKANGSWSQILAEYHQASTPVKTLKKIAKGIIICEHCNKKLNINNFKPLSISRCEHCDNPNFIPKQIMNYYLFEPFASDNGSRTYKAFNISDLHTEFLIKILTETPTHTRELIKAFEKEIHIGEKVKEHPHFIQICDYGYSHEDYFIVTEKIDGIRLDMLADSSYTLKQEQIMLWALQILKAEHFLYDQGFLYRNLRPENIFIDQCGNVKLGNFSRVENRQQQTKEQLKPNKTATFIHYMSPERVRGEHEDQASEIYSLGMLLYQILTHEHYFSGHRQQDIAQKHVSPIRMSNLVPKMPAGTNNELIRIVNKMIKPLPEERYNNYIELGNDLFKLFNKYCRPNQNTLFA